MSNQDKMQTANSKQPYFLQKFPSETNNDYLNQLLYLLQHCEFTCNNKNFSDYNSLINNTAQIFSDIRSNKKHAFFIGNGGSAAIAIHMTADFFRKGGMNTISLYDSSMITCLGNDYGYEYIFSKQIERIAEKGDLIIAISSSGKSPNIVRAVEATKEKGAEVLSFTGFDSDNPTRNLSSYSIYVPSHEYGFVESIHNIILQQVVDLIGE